MGCPRLNSEYYASLARGGFRFIPITSFQSESGQWMSVATSKVYGDSGATYNRLGQQLTVTDAVGTRTFGYSDKLQLTGEAIAGIYNKVINRGYDSLGRSSSFSLQGDNYSVSYAYDNLGRFSSVTSGSDTFTYSYLANSNLVSSIQYPASISVTKSYESNRDLVTSIENKYGQITISKYDYSNDDLGRRTAMGKSGTAFTQADSIAYGYNDKSEVTSAVAQNQNTFNYLFNFDPIGNRVTSATTETGAPVQTAYTANNLNQYSLINDGAPKTPIYDFDGNILSVGDGWVYEYNGANRMVKATNGTTVMEFGYDYAGREIYRKKTEGGTVTSHIRYIWNRMDKIEELNVLDSNSVLKKYVWGLDLSRTLRKAGGSGGLLSENNSNGNFYAFFDGNGNVSEYLNPSGSISAHYEYSPSGKIIVATGSNPDDFSFRFSTKELEQNTGLVLYQLRPYSPVTGKWMTREPVEERGSYNLYGVCRNDIINKGDFLGLVHYHGNWGGWDWTGGQEASWDEISEDGRGNNVQPPVDAQDACYEQHDKCYGQSRNDYQSETARHCAFAICDAKLEGCLLTTIPTAPVHQAGALIVFPFVTILNPLFGMGEDLIGSIGNLF